MKTNLFFIFLFAIILGLALPSCDKLPSKGNVKLNLKHLVNSEALVFDTIKYAGAAGHKYSVSNLKYYISKIVLTANNGTKYEVNTPYYCDAQNLTTLSPDLGEVPNGTYTSISFVFGLDSTINHPNGLSNTTENINMIWPIMGEEGYHYMKLEGKYDSLSMGIVNKNYNTHTGPTGGNDNSIHFSFPLSNLEVNGNNWTIQLIMDINEWYQNPVIYDFVTWGQMIMMNANAQAALKQNGVDVFTLGTVSLN